MDHFVNNNQDESFLYSDNYKIIKITNTAYIYSNHIRNKLNNIYMNSPSVEFVEHTKDTKYIRHNLDEMKILYDKLHNAIKYDMYLHKEYCNSYRGDYNTLENTSKTITKSIDINKNIFFCTHNFNNFTHTLAYMYPLIYFYCELKKKIHDLVLVISYESKYTTFLLNTLNINDYIVIKHNECIINNSNTYFANCLNCNITENIVNTYFYDIVVKQTLLSSVKINKNDFPKKICFLRKNGNIITKGFLMNSNEIINISNKYGYVDIDQTLLSLNECICLVNNATHIMCESGSAMIHLLWNKNIKSIILVTRKLYVNTLARLCEDAEEKLKLTSDNLFCDIAKIRKSKIIYDDYNYIKTNKTNYNTNENYKFMNLIGIQKALEENDSNIEDITYKIYKDTDN